MNETPIREFQGDFRFLSNFWYTPVEFEGITYASVEHAYQAAKTLNQDERQQVALATAGQAKRMGRTLTLRPDWKAVKVSVMLGLVHTKFETNAALREKLLDTGNRLLIEGNTWGDTFWGVCRGRGENTLGKILMTVRNRMREP